MKVSVSLSNDDVAFLDKYSRDRGIRSRSAALHKAVGLLRAAELGPAYADAWEEWEGSEDSDAWEAVIADGLNH